MVKSTHATQLSFRKTKPTIFPLGFAAAQVDNSTIIIEFLDEIEEKMTILESVALPREKAIQLMNALKSALEDEDKDD